MTDHLVTSRIIELDKPRNIVVREETLDLTRLKPSELAGRTIYSAVSPGTEIAAYVGDPPLRPMKVYPRVVGYCNVAEVIGVGADVTDYKVGDRILNFQSHRSNFICSEQSVAALIPQDCRDLVAVSTTYLFHLGYNALLKGNFRPGMSVAVIGLGTLGLTTLALASSFGGVVYALSDQKESLDKAVKFGAESVYLKSGTGSVDDIRRQTEGGVDLVITTSGRWDDWLLALRLARKEGCICVIGFPGRTEPIPGFNPLDSSYFYDSQLKIVSCGYTPHLDVPPYDIRFTMKRNCSFLLKQVIRGKLPALEIVSKVVPWREIQGLYDTMASHEPGFLTGVLDWT